MAVPVNSKLEIDVTGLELSGNYILEEGVTTPNGTTIRRRSMQQI